MTPIYTYTVDLPYTVPEYNRREFYRLPRSILLPPYLAINPYFVDFTDAIDTVFDSTIEAKTDALRNIRNMWVTTKAMEEKIKDPAGSVFSSNNTPLVEFYEWGGVDRTTLIQQVNLLGMKLTNTGVFSESGFRALSRFLGVYWFEKGRASTIDFINFCLGSTFRMYRMWTSDYINFLAEGDPGIGTTIYDAVPGIWYPTTHVVIETPPGYGVDPAVMTEFFYEIVNYNVVLYAIREGQEANLLSIDSSVAMSVINLALEEATIVNFVSSN
jgi:hypothetical protein